MNGETYAASGSPARLADVTANNPPVLEKVLGSVANKMLADFEASGAVVHRGSKGTVREAILLDNYLRKYLPSTVVAVHSGEVITTTGEVSEQCDILILDPSTPPFWDEADYRIVPVECLFGVIEVKSNLTSDELSKTWEKIARLKSFPKTAFLSPLGPQQTRTVYGRTWEHFPTVGMIFAYDGADLETLGNRLTELADTCPPEQRLDSVWVLNKGYLVWIDSERQYVNATAEPDSGLAATAATPAQVLMALTMHLHEHFARAWTTGLKFRAYLGNTMLGAFVQKWFPVVESADDGSSDVPLA